MSNKTSDENVANEEITNNKNKYTYIKEVAERIVNEYREKYKDEKFYPQPSEQTCMAYEILHLLAEREQKDKRIQELEAKLLDMIQGTEIINKETPEYVKENYIPIQVVKDKIKEIKRLRDKCITTEGYNIANGEVVVLQELLEGERK